MANDLAVRATPLHSAFSRASDPSRTAPTIVALFPTTIEQQMDSPDKEAEVKRFLIVIMVTGLVAGSVATAEAKKAERKRVERTVEGSYTTQFVPFGGMITRTCRRDGAVGCVTIETHNNEAFLTAKAVDAHGQPVFVSVEGWESYGGSGRPIDYGTFCGETDEPIAVPGGVELYLRIGYFWLTDLPTSLTTCPPMFGTTGTVSVTLSNLP